MKTPLQVLLVEDSPTDADLLQQVFLKSPQKAWQMAHVERLKEGIEACCDRNFDIVLLDLCLPDSNGLDTVTLFRAAVPNTPVVVLTVLDYEELALKAMAEGAQDYLVKDRITLQRLERAVRLAVQREKVLQQLRESEEKYRLALAKEEEIKQLKLNFFAMLFHELRNPLTTVRTSAEILQSYYDQLTEERKNKQFERIYAASDRMQQILDRVLMLRRTETSRFAYQPASLNLAAFCQELVEDLQMIASTQQRIIFSCEGECNFVEMDKNLLHHILINLLSNALKYSPLNSTVQFSIRCQDDTATFQIQDRGIGIPQQEMGYLFQPFYRCSNVNATPGTGLGLTLVKQCVDVYKGQIQVESQENVGTTFTVTLPLKQ